MCSMIITIQSSIEAWERLIETWESSIQAWERSIEAWERSIYILDVAVIGNILLYVKFISKLSWGSLILSVCEGWKGEKIVQV